MRKKELESQLTTLQETVGAQDIALSIAMSEAATYKQQHLNGLKDAGWTALDPHGTKRNRTWDDVRTNLEDAYAAHCVNPFAKSYVDYVKFFVIGRGTTATAEKTDEEGQKRIDLFLEANDWELLEKEITAELSRDGEVFIQFWSTNEYKMKSEVSLVQLIDPLEIIAIKKDDKGEPQSYMRRWTPPGETSPKDEEIAASEIYHIKINASHNEDRGRSDLLPALPWLKMHKAWLTDMARRNYYSGAINWDITLKGGLKPSDYTSKYVHGPAPGTALFHGENEIWQMMSPDMKYADSTAGARALKLMICALFKMPESWFGDTGESNLATTKALAMPTLKMFTDRQDEEKMHFERIISQGAGVENVTVKFPELVVEEANVKAQALFSLSQAITNLIADEVITKELAYGFLKAFDEELPEWDEVKKQLEEDDAESVAKVAAGQSKARPLGPRLEEEGAPPFGSVQTAVPPAPPGVRA